MFVYNKYAFACVYNLGKRFLFLLLATPDVKNGGNNQKSSHKVNIAWFLCSPTSSGKSG